MFFVGIWFSTLKEEVQNILTIFVNLVVNEFVPITLLRKCKTTIIFMKMYENMQTNRNETVGWKPDKY